MGIPILFSNIRNAYTNGIYICTALLISECIVLLILYFGFV